MGKNWYVTGDGNWDVEAVERMKHVRVFCIGLMINELTTLIAACVGLSYYQNMNDENPSFFFEDLITSMELTITASILALIVYGRLLWIDFDSDKYTGVHALIKWATLFVSMVFNFEAANTAMKVYTVGDVRALIFIMYSAGAFGKIFICLFANHSGFTGAMIGGPIMNDFFVVFIGAAIQRDLTGDKAYSNLFLAASILYMYASTLYVFENREDIVKALVVILTLAAAFARVASENVNNGEFKAHNFFLFCQFL
eukprot:g4109.t1